jgi:ABC-2 type transport system ATP-binding protein
MNAIELRDVRCRLGKGFEIRDLALSVPAGSVYGFLGPNGSGKTTTIRLMLGMLRPDGGTITVLGHGIPRAVATALRDIGYVPEQSHLYPTLSVEESLHYHAAFYPGWDAARAQDLLARFDLDRARPVGRLSKGETGKLLMLLALAHQPRLLVLDEPTDGLDPVVRRDVLTALVDYVSQRDATVFISSHLVHELEPICDWVGVMDRGQVATELPMQAFKRGIKRLRVVGAPSVVAAPPFNLLARDPGDGMGGEVWVVRDWEPPMVQYFAGIGATLREVLDLDLEDGFVELLRSFRRTQG